MELTLLSRDMEEVKVGWNCEAERFRMSCGIYQEALLWVPSLTKAIKKRVMRIEMELMVTGIPSVSSETVLLKDH